MRPKWICLALAGVLALSLCACAPGGEAPDPAETPSQPVETAPVAQEPSAEPTMGSSVEPSVEPDGEPSDSLELVRDGVTVLRIPRRDYQPWQEGYMNFLIDLLRAENSGLEAQAAYGGLAVDERSVKAFDHLWDTMEMGSENYSLCDVDGDGVPELFVKYGNCEAAYTTQCYTWRGGEIVCIGEFDSGHSSLCTDPGRSALVVNYGHMGYQEIQEFPMVDGRLERPQVLFAGEVLEDDTAMDEIVPGAELLDGYYTELCMMDFLPLEQERPNGGIPRVLPICDYYAGPATTGASSEDARVEILAALRGETKLCGVSGDGFYGDTGWTTWEEYVQPGAAYPYNDSPLEITRHAWQDMNGDGQEECVLRLETADEYPARALVVLSGQRGTVFAYYFGFYDEAELDAGGVLRHVWGLDGNDAALSFWENQCYEYAVRDEGTAGAVEWLDGSPLD